jgi:hypothetical protein
MSRVVVTEHGTVRGAEGSPSGWLLECPGCGEWLPISEDMLHGRISVDHATDGCPGRYHETHDFASASTRRKGPPFVEGCAKRGGVCDCGGRPCGLDVSGDERHSTPQTGKERSDG